MYTRVYIIYVYRVQHPLCYIVKVTKIFPDIMVKPCSKKLGCLQKEVYSYFQLVWHNGCCHIWLL
jgi:hypothetical protein